MRGIVRIKLTENGDDVAKRHEHRGWYVPSGVNCASYTEEVISEKKERVEGSSSNSKTRGEERRGEETSKRQSERERERDE